MYPYIFIVTQLWNFNSLSISKSSHWLFRRCQYPVKHCTIITSYSSHTIRQNRKIANNVSKNLRKYLRIDYITQITCEFHIYYIELWLGIDGETPIMLRYTHHREFRKYFYQFQCEDYPSEHLQNYYQVSGRTLISNRFKYSLGNLLNLVSYGHQSRHALLTILHGC